MSRSEETSTDYDQSIEILVLGDSGVGKSALLNRLANNAFELHWRETTDPWEVQHHVIIDGKVVRLILTEYPTRYAGYAGNLLRKQQGFVVVFDVNDRQSFESVLRWKYDIERCGNPHYKLMVLGNGCDRDTREVSKEELARHAAELKAIEFSVSAACNDTQVDKAFAAFTRLIIVAKADRDEPRTANLPAP